MTKVLLVLVVVVVLSPGRGLSPTLVKDCDDAEKVVTEGGTQVILKKEIKEREVYAYAFVKHESGFKGVHLDVYGSDGTHHAAWFPVEPQCFLQDNVWQYTKAWANTNTNGINSLTLGFDIDTCKVACRIDSPAPIPYTFSVVAHGTSKWVHTNPPGKCNIRYLAKTKLSSTVPPCKDPPGLTTITTTLTTTNTWSHLTKMLIIGASTIGIAVVVLVVVVVVVEIKLWQATNCDTTHRTQLI